MAQDGRVRFRVVTAEDGLTLRQLLCRRFSDLRPQTSAELIKAGGAYIDNVRIRLPSVRVMAGERMTVYRGAAEVAVLDPADLQIVHRDPEFVIVDKPAGIPPNSTRASARGTVAQALVYRLCAEGMLRPYVGPVRPIPSAASGLVLYTIRDQDAVSLQKLYLRAEVTTVDRVLVKGDAPAILRCDQPLLLTRSGRLEVCSAGALGASPASTELRRLDTKEGDGGRVAEGEPRVVSLLEARARGAFGAQAAVHSAALGFPVADPSAALGGANRGEPGVGLLLHRSRLELVHPHSGERLCFDSPMPAWGRLPQGSGA